MHRSSNRRPGRQSARRRRVLAMGLITGLLLTVVPVGPADGQDAPPPAEGPKSFAISPEMRAGFDRIYSVATPSSCLTVSVGGIGLYSRNGQQGVVPASTQKLVTGVIALDQLGSDTRFVTRVMTAAAPTAGVINGDLALVGGGDPVLGTNAVIAVRKLGPELHPTSLDELADGVKAAGITRISGGVIGDEGRYDQQRFVESWPSRFIDQEQSGPLSALSVNDGYRWKINSPTDAKRTRSVDPALMAAEVFTDLLRERGIQVDGEASAGTTPGSHQVAMINSDPLGEIVDEMLMSSDNQTAELLTKELGLKAGGGGSTTAGVAVINARMNELGLASPATHIVDGSGLDPSNKATCEELVAVLDYAGGPDSQIGRGLPVAAQSGTLRNRFKDTSAAGKLRAKTGRLNSVSSLAGYVPLASGEVATFAFVVNDMADEQRSWAAQTVMGMVLAEMDLPCGDAPAPVVVAPDALVGSVGTLSGFPLQGVMVPAMIMPVQVLKDRAKTLVDACLAQDEDFGVILAAPSSSEPISAGGP